MNNLCAAIEMACEVHAQQKDKAGKPYILHPLHVMMQMHTEEEMIVAVLHDVLEDCSENFRPILNKDILDIFGNKIHEAIYFLTHEKGEPYKKYLAIVKTNSLALKVKIADIKHNSSEDRLVYLDQATQDRLRKKYKEALEYLES